MRVIGTFIETEIDEDTDEAYLPLLFEGDETDLDEGDE